MPDPGRKGFHMLDTPAPLLYGYSDADWATTDIDERRTCIGYFVFLSGAAIFWLTRFWKPCLSTFEGELGALTEVAKTTIAAREMLSSIPLSWYDENKDEPTTLLNDTAATKQATDNPKHHSRVNDSRICELQGTGAFKVLKYPD